MSSSAAAAGAVQAGLQRCCGARCWRPTGAEPGRAGRHGRQQAAQPGGRAAAAIRGGDAAQGRLVQEEATGG
jgi:hypothetical protein